MKMYSKIFLTGEIELLTGLHIGGNSAGLELANIVSIIKDKMDYPYIPGSSLKGKVRSLLENAYECEKKTKLGLHETGDIVEIFGMSASNENIVTAPTRILVRDSYIIVDNDIDEDDLIEIKSENTINRINGKAMHPREIERVTAGNKFKLNLVFNIFHKERDYDLLLKFLTGLELLNGDYLGGSGSRGYGDINITFDQIVEKTIKDYETGNNPSSIIDKKHTVEELKEKIKEIYNENLLGE